MKYLKLIIIGAISLVASTSFAGAKLAGNGGGTLIRDGNMVTFGSAHIPLKPAEDIFIPGLAEAQAGIMSLNISSGIQGQLLTGLMPSDKRKYFWVSRSDINSATYARLVKVYSNLAATDGMGSHNQIAIVAVTSHQDTYLIDDSRYGFKNLSDRISQAAILFHEAIRVVNPKLSTAQVVNLEISFEHYLRGKNDVAIYFQIAKLFPTLGDTSVIQAYINHDLAHHDLDPLLVPYDGISPKFSVRGLFNDSLDAYVLVDIPFENLRSPLNIDKIKWLNYLKMMAARTPSLFVRFLLKNFTSVAALPSFGGYLMDKKDFEENTLDTQIDAESLYAGFGGYAAPIGGRKFLKGSNVRQRLHGENDSPMSISLVLPPLDPSYLLDENEVDYSIETRR